MSVIGPRPALWNQDVLIAEREKYNANDVKPGLTGWAQINGRDELEIPVKAKLDGEYVEKESLFFDIKCFLGTIGKVAKDDSVVEGGTGEMGKQEISEEIKENEKKKILVICQYYKPEPFRISDICEELVHRGHEVHVVTGYPNYPEGVLYEGYGKSHCRSRSRNSCIAACDHKYRLSDPIGLYYQLWFDCRPWMCDRRRRTYFSGDCDQGRKSDSKSNKN